MSIPRGQTEARKEYMREYVRTHPKRDRRVYKAAYDASHREQLAQYRKSNSARLKKQKAQYYALNRDRLLAAVRARMRAKSEQISTYQARYYAQHSERVRSRVAAYRAANPEKKRHLENKRRARKAANGGSHTLDELINKFSAMGNRCCYCGADGKMTVDHDIPLSRGGTDDIENILPACHSCNSSKNTKTGSEFIAWLNMRSRTNHAAIGGIGRKPTQEYQGR